MQMAMVLTSQKPTQRDRYGEVPEGLPGSTLERGRREEKRQELERPSPLLARGRASQPNEGRLMAERESDSLVVLGGWESHLQGEGVDRNTPPSKETWADMKDRTNHANLTAGLAIEGSRIAFLRMRVFLKSPALANGTPGSVRGASGNRRPYRDGCPEENRWSQRTR